MESLIEHQDLRTRTEATKVNASDKPITKKKKRKRPNDLDIFLLIWGILLALGIGVSVFG